MLRSLPGCLVSMTTLTFAMYLIEYQDSEDMKSIARIIFMVAIISFLLFYSVGYSSTPWAVQSEIFPIHLVSTGCALATATNWLSNFAVSSVFLTSMATKAGHVYTFGILATFCFLTTLFIYFKVPETSGRRIEENINNVLKGKVF